MERNSLEKLYAKYSYLAKRYAQQLYNTHRVGLEIQDIEQELSIKIFTSIKAYAKKIASGQKTVPLVNYIQTALNNKLRDYIKKIQNTTPITPLACGEEDGVDFGFQRETNFIDLKKKTANIGGVDLYEGLKGIEKTVWTLILKGHTVEELSKKFKKLPVAAMIQQQREKLEIHKDTMWQATQQQKFQINLSA